MRRASLGSGFYTLTGHGVRRSLIDSTFDMARRFFELPEHTKAQIRVDRAGWPLGGVGYLPFGERKLPRRARGNGNEAFIVKSGSGIRPEENQWPDARLLPEMRSVVEAYQRAATALARSMLPVYSVALDLEPEFFAPAFTAPFCRLRLSHYPQQPPRGPEMFGIAPHVDSTFFTILAQDSAGLTIHSRVRDAWVEVPATDDLVVNTGELLKQWSNDRFVSARHFVRGVSDKSRYAIPFFFNADADWVMRCLPSCCGPHDPPRYPPVSYRQSQALAQGE